MNFYLLLLQLKPKNTEKLNGNMINSFSTTSTLKIKTKKCQLTAGDTPDLIKTECVPNSELTHPNKKITEHKNYKNYKIHWFSKKPLKCLRQNGNMINTFSSISTLTIKTKKCQPTVGDTPDLIQTECVPDSGLAHQKSKLKSKITGKTGRN